MDRQPGDRPTIAALAQPATDETGGVRRPMAGAASFATVGLFVIAVAAVLHFGRDVLAPTVAGLLVGLTLAPIVDWLGRRGLPAALSSALIVLGSVAVTASLVVAMAVPLETWSARIPEITSELEMKWQEIRGPLERLKQVEQQVQEATDSDEDAAMQVAVQSPGIVTAMVSSAPDVSAHVLIFLATLYFFLSGRSALRRQVLGSFVRFRRRRAAVRMLRDIERSLSHYVLTIAAINAAFGVVVGLAMWLLGLPSPHLWGALAAILNFALYIGPAAMAVILLGVAAITYDGMSAAILPPLVYVGLNLLEGQFVTPTILGRRFTMTPLVVFLALVLWLWIWGVLGAFLAIPILIVARIVLVHLAPRFRFA
ncbi:AI-2E family transporter [Amorphus sp. MBR-141]